MSAHPAAPESATSALETRIPLVQWGQAMDRALTLGEAALAAALAQAVLQRYPRHLATYARLLRAAWLLRRWQEGADWGRRLLQADPGNPTAWQAVARDLENRGDRTAARSVWQRAFESDPYASEIRVGLSRTSLGVAEPLLLNQACLATLYLRSYRWKHAGVVYRSLLEANPRRSDFLAGWMVALWRQGHGQEAYQVARHIVRHQPHVFMAWVVIRAVGDETDRALAQNPILTMDPDGEFVRQRLYLDNAPTAERNSVRSAGRHTLIAPTSTEMDLLARMA